MHINSECNSLLDSYVSSVVGYHVCFLEQNLVVIYGHRWVFRSTFTIAQMPEIGFDVRWRLNSLTSASVACVKEDLFLGKELHDCPHKCGLGWYIGKVVVAVAWWVGEVARFGAGATVAVGLACPGFIA